MERKIKEEVGGLCERRCEREGTVRRGGVRPSCMEATPRRSGIKMKMKKKKKKKKKKKNNNNNNCPFNTLRSITFPSNASHSATVSSPRHSVITTSREFRIPTHK